MSAQDNRLDEVLKQLSIQGQAIASLQESVKEINKKQPLPKEAVGSVLKESREKWLGNICKNGKLNEFFSSYDAYAMWEMIRKAVCLICKERYIRQLSGGKEDFANYAADKIFQTIYDLAEEYKNLQKKEKANE